jgi:hypothetical protein
MAATYSLTERERLYRQWLAAWRQYDRVSTLYAPATTGIGVPLRPAVAEDPDFQELKLAECSESLAWRAYEAYLEATGLLPLQEDPEALPNDSE